MLLSISLLLSLSYSIASAAFIPSSASLGLSAQSNNSNSLPTINLFNATKGECHTHGEQLYFVYKELGDDIKTNHFAKLIYHLNKNLKALMEVTHASWNDRIGLGPIHWGTRDYWFSLDKMNDPYWELTWHWLQAVFGLLDECYERGQIREFDAYLYYDSKKLGRVRVYFYRGPDGILEMD